MNPTSLTGASQDQFLQLLVAQLQNQDPLSPADSTQFVSQLATFSQLQETQKLTASFDQMLKLQQLTQGSSLLGKTVEYAPATGANPVAGTVSALTVQNGTVLLTVGSAAVALDQVTHVTA
jgi:flagellar basal-body rod modification protein FlgD